MPKITITEQDLTGNAYTGDEVVVYVPGFVSPREGTLDAQNCVLIKSLVGIKEYFDVSEKDEDKKYTTLIFAEQLLNAGFDVLYHYIEEDNGVNVDFLQDKNAYNVRFLTTGNIPGCLIKKVADLRAKVKALEEEDRDSNAEEIAELEKIISDAGDHTYTEDTSIYGYNLAPALAKIAADRHDCVFLLNLDAEGLTDAEVKKAIDETGAISFFSAAPDLSYCTAFRPNGNYTLYSELMGETVTDRFYGNLAYLIRFAEQVAADNRWDSVAGVTRGVAPNSFSGGDPKMLKYILDNTILTTDGISFNGIVYINPYGNVIWGDRTLLRNSSGTGLKASSFLSIRNLVCDLCRRVYQTSIRYTYETNSDITWMNYKSEITDLLDQMTADYKLASYEMVRVPTSARATIKCKIKLVPVEPVEDFDIFITLENGEAEVTEG